MKTVLAGLLAAVVLAACNSPKNRSANCIMWSGNGYAVAQLRDNGKTEAEATAIWMDMIKHMSSDVTKRMKQEIAWVYANPAKSQNQVEVDRYKACMSESWPAFKS